MTKIIIAWRFPTLTKRDLIDLVVANDASQGEEPIAAENVVPTHVLDIIASLESDGFEVECTMTWEED